MENNTTTFRDEVTAGTNPTNWQNIIISVVLGLIIGFGLGYLVFAHKIFAPSSTDDIGMGNEIRGTTSTTSTRSLNSSVSAAGTMEITAEDQEPGLRAHLSSLKLDQGAWVVTFTSIEDESRPERIIGAQYFEKGTYAEVDAYLGEGLIADQTYYVALYEDNEEGAATHTFNYELDQPYLKNGGWIMDSFRTLSTGSRG